MSPVVRVHTSRPRAGGGTAGAENGFATTSAANRYPCFGTVSIHADAPSPSALRSVEIWNERLASSTKVSGQSAVISSCFENARPGLLTSNSNRSKVFGGSATRWCSRVRTR